MEETNKLHNPIWEINKEGQDLGIVNKQKKEYKNEYMCMLIA